MQQSNRPNKFLAPFAVNDPAKVDIPLTTADSTRASQSLGFPPLTGTPPEAGGVPPQREDFNGAMNQVARVPWWLMLGGRFPFDNGFATDPAISGYPNGAVLPSVVTVGDWCSTADNNVADPDTSTTGWVPGYHYGALVLTGQVGGSVTLTPAQAAKRLITIAGTLTSNLVIIVPAWVYSWDVINNTGGAFTVTIKTATTGGVEVAQDGLPARLLCDGTNVVRVVPTLPSATTTAVGVQRNATNSEANAATLTNATVTPANLAQTKALGWMPDLVPALNAKADAAATSAALATKAPGGNFLYYEGDGSVIMATDPGWGNSWRVTTQGLTAYSGGALALSYSRSAGTWEFVGKLIPSNGFRDGSSRTIKTHIEYLDPASSLRAVIALRSARFYLNDDDERTPRLGYYAEDVMEVMPEPVAAGAPGARSPYTIEDTQMLPHHTAAIQALHHMITELRDRVAELESNR